MATRILKRLFIIGLIALSSCKNEDSPLDILGGTSGGSSNVEQLTITSVIPDQSDVILEIGQSQSFTLIAQAPFPNEVTYQWSYDGSPIAAVNTYTLSAQVSHVGNHILKVVASDGESSQEKIWNIKVNGPPVLSAITTGTQKVSFNSSIAIQALATDPNGDSITYSWFLDGAPSAYVTGTNGTGTVIGDSSLVGSHVVTLQVSDGSQTASLTWNLEVNFFPQACNELVTGEICTYAGSPHKGNGLSPSNTLFPLRFRPWNQVQDALGNLFISDSDNNVVWYWNNTGAPVSRLGQTIPAGVIQVIAGTGEDSTGPVGIAATDSALNNPKGLWYDDAFDRLFIAEYDGDQVKYVDSTGIVFVGFGGGASNVNGDTAFNHDCNRPVDLSHYNGDLFISCYNNHRVKRWNLATDLGYVAAGDAGNDVAGQDSNALTSGVGTPHGIFVDGNGIYITNYNFNVVRFVNTTAAPITFWTGNPDQVTVNPGNVATIMGTGANGGAPANGNPRSSIVGRPVAVTVRNGNEIYVSGQNSDDLILGNNSALPVTIDALMIPNGESGRFNDATGGYNGSSFGVNSTRFNDSYGLSFDNQDNNRLLIADYSNFRLRSVDVSNGDVVEVAGSGKGKNGFYGDVSLAVFEHLMNSPTGLAFDSANRLLFIADQNNHALRQVDPFGRMQTVIGFGGAAGDPIIDNDLPSNAKARTNINNTNSLNNGFDIWSDGSLLQLNSYGHNLRVWNRSSSDQIFLNQYIQRDRISTVGGDYTTPGTNDGPALTAQLNYPNSAKFYNNGGNMEIFIADTMNHCIRKIDNAGNMSTVLGLCGTSGDPGNNVAEAAARFNRPRGLAVDSIGNLFITDFQNEHIWYWNRSAAPITIGTVTINPNFIAVVSCIGGAAGSTSENILVASARCGQPTGIAVHGNDVCYAQRSRHNVRCFNRNSGIVRTVAGRIEASVKGGSTFDFSQEGVAGTSATLLNPSGVTFDSNGDLYISDTNNHVVKKLKLSP